MTTQLICNNCGETIIPCGIGPPHDDCWVHTSSRYYLCGDGYPGFGARPRNEPGPANLEIVLQP